MFTRSGATPRFVERSGGKHAEPSSGFTMLEMVLGFTILSMILMGIMATFSTGFIAQRDNSELSENQLLTRQVCEELQDIQFADLLGFNGTAVTSPNGKNRAAISVTGMGVDLVRIQVVSSSVTRPEITSRAVTLVSNPD
jgi:Tfp pilus assembly protein PilV